MAFQVRGLPVRSSLLVTASTAATADRIQRLAAATTELWPSLPTALAKSSRRWIATSPTFKSNIVPLHHTIAFSDTGVGSTVAVRSNAKPKWPVQPGPVGPVGPVRGRPVSPSLHSRGLAHGSSNIIPSAGSILSSRWLFHTCTRPRPWWFLLQGQAGHGRGFGSEALSHNLLANREAIANRNPNSASAQNAFYQVLLSANMPGIVVERYQSGRFARNEAADEAYQRALSMLAPSSAGQLGGPTMQAGGYVNQTQAVAQALAAQSQGAHISMTQPSQGAAQGPIRVVVDETYGAIALKWVKFAAWFGLICYLSMVVVTLAVDSLQTMKRPAKMGEVEVKPEHQKARFSDVFGCDEAKEELEELVEFLRNPAKFSTLGGKLPKGVLMVGPPGTGKTLLARAVAGEAGVPFFYMSGSDFDEVYVGVGAKRVRDLFTAAKAKSPSIVFIDELDAIGGKRQPRDVAYVRQTLNQLLTELDGFEQNSGVIIMAATNFPQALDKALTRPGRFDHHIKIDLPDVRGRMAILSYYLKKIKAAGEIDVQALAARTQGLSGAELENIVNQAAIHASKARGQFVTMSDMEWAKDKIIMGSEKKSMVITEEEKLATAYHEAGHAIVALYNQDNQDQLYKVTVLPRGFTLGHTAWLPQMDKHSRSAKDYLAHMDRCMGGKVAEEVIYGSNATSDGVSSDLDMATQMAWRMVGSCGMSEKLGPVDYIRNYQSLSSETRAMVESEVKRLLDESYQRARTLLLSKRKELDMLAQALVEYETLDKTEVERVLRGEPLVGRKPVPPGPVTVTKPPNPLVPGEQLLPPLHGTGNGTGTEPGSGPQPPVAGGDAMR